MMDQENGLEKKTLREWREAAGLTQVDLAELAECSRTHLQLLECGGATIGPHLGKRIGDVLGIDWEQIAHRVAQVDKHSVAWAEDGLSNAAPRQTLKWWQQRRSLSGREVALLAGVAPSVVQRINAGSSQPVVPITRRKLAQALEVHPDKLILPGDDIKSVERQSVEDLLRAELNGKRRALKKCYDFLSQDPNITFRSQDARDALLRDIGPELKGL